MSNSFLAFDVFVFNRMRHNGLLLLLVMLYGLPTWL